MTAADIACRVCAQQPGEPCLSICDVHQQIMDIFHPQRIEDAAAISEPAKAVDPALVDAAFEAVADEIA